MFYRSDALLLNYQHHRSFTVVCQHSCTTNCTGWTWQRASLSSSASRRTVVCMDTGQAPRYLADHVTPAIEVASQHRLRSANRHRLIVPRCRLNTYGLFRSLVRRSWTHCQMNSEIRRVMSTASNSSLKQSCSALTSVTSELEVIFNVMRSINPRFTYLLTYLLTYLHSTDRFLLVFMYSNTGNM